MKIITSRDKNYMVMSNYHFKDKRLSLKAKGLLSLMLSLPNEWNYSLLGLTSICVESGDTIRNILKELKDYKCLRVVEQRQVDGKFNYEYIIHESPYE